MNIALRDLTTADIDAADEILRSAFRSHDSREPDLRRFFAVGPALALLAVADGEPAGMVGATGYDEFVYVGMMAVHTRFQRHGIGALLMQRLLAQLDELQVPAIALDASIYGAPLYAKLGFVDVDGSIVVLGDAPTAPVTRPLCVRPLEAQELPALCAFDTPVFGADRSRVLAHLLNEFPGRTFVTTDAAGQLTGYVIAQSQRLGPWVATNAPDAKALFQAAMALPFAGPLRCTCPQQNPHALDLFQRHGFRIVDPTHRHMVRGRLPRTRRREWVYGQTSFSMG